MATGYFIRYPHVNAEDARQELCLFCHCFASEEDEKDVSGGTGLV